MKYLERIKNFDIEKKIISFSKKIKKEDILVLLTVLGIGLVNFFYFLINTVLSPDGLTYGPFYKSGRWEFQLGRPLLAVVDRLRGGIVSPPIIVFFSLIYIAITIMILRRVFQIKSKLSLFIISIFLVLFPTISNTALFIYCFDSYCLSLLFSALGIYFIKNKKYLFSILSIIISLSLYQAYICVTITGVLILFIIDIINNKESIKKLIFNMLIIFIGLVIYYILLKIGISLFGLNLAQYKGASSFGINTVLSLPNSIINSYKDFVSFFILDSIIYNNYHHRQIINIILLLLSFITIIPLLKKLNTSKKILLIISIILLPITINIMDLIACETRIDMITAIGYIMTYLFIIILSEKYTKINLIKSMNYLLIIVLSYTYLLSNNASFQVRVDVFNNYYTNSMIILNKVKSLENYNEDLPWMFNNTINYSSVMAPASNDKNVNLLETFYGYLGIKENEFFYKRFLGEEIYVIEEDKYNEMKEKDEFKSMTKGDVKIIDGIVVIKVSDEDY